ASVTAAGGVATFTDLTLAGLAGTYALTFNVDGLPSASSSPFSLSAGPAFALRVRTQPDGAIVAQTFATQPVIEIVDAGGNVVPEDGVVVSASVVANRAGIVGPTASSVAGVATFTALTMFGTVGSYTANFSANGLAGATSLPFHLAAGAATHLVVLDQPTTAQNGVPLNPPPFLAAEDASGNQADHTAPVTVTVASGTGTVTASLPFSQIFGGASVFPGLVLSGPVGPVALTFHSGNLQPASARSISLLVGGVDRLVVTTAPPSVVTSGVPMVPQPVVEVHDVGGNVVPMGIIVSLLTDSAGVTITNGSIIGDNGIAKFSALTLTGPPGTRRYEFELFEAPQLRAAVTIKIQ